MICILRNEMFFYFLCFFPFFFGEGGLGSVGSVGCRLSLLSGAFFLGVWGGGRRGIDVDEWRCVYDITPS